MSSSWQRSWWTKSSLSGKRLQADPSPARSQSQTVSVSHSEEDSLVAMLRFQEFERSTVDTEGAMGLAAILAGQLPELKGKK